MRVRQKGSVAVWQCEGVSQKEANAKEQDARPHNFVNFVSAEMLGNDPDSLLSCRSL